jgi:hypothetical protein
MNGFLLLRVSAQNVFFSHFPLRALCPFHVMLLEQQRPAKLYLQRELNEYGSNYQLSVM